MQNLTKYVITSTLRHYGLVTVTTSHGGAALESIRLLTWLHNGHYPVYHRSQFAFALLLAPLL
jgi:hypothetical protein